MRTPRPRTLARWCLTGLTALLITAAALSGWWRFFFDGPIPGAYCEGGIEAGRLEAIVVYPVGPMAIRRHYGVLQRPPLVSESEAMRQMLIGWPPGPPTTRFYWWGHWWIHLPQSSPGQALSSIALEVPLWPIAALLAIPSALAWLLHIVRRRRLSAGLCTSCRYDRRGLSPNATCPECGHVP